MSSDITVIVMTYNHKQYISKALDSILSQLVDVNFDILVHDDSSNDGTYDILLDYKKKFNDKIKIIRQSERVFLKDGFNKMLFKYVVPHIHAKYIAYCDGDDYWIDNNKLQKQFDFMETHEDYSLCFHNAFQLKPNGDKSSKWFIDKEGNAGIKDILTDEPGIHIATSSIFLKSNVFINFPSWRLNYPVEDVPLYMLSCIMGKVYRLKDIMCVYRQFAVGSWSYQNKQDINRIISHISEMKNSAMRFDEETNRVYHDVVLNHINGIDFRIALLTNDHDSIFSKKYKSVFKKMDFKDKVMLRIKYRHPLIYKILHNNR